MLAPAAGELTPMADSTLAIALMNVLPSRAAPLAVVALVPVLVVLLYWVAWV